MLEHNIRRAELRDAAAITRIYNFYIENTVATFEEEAIAAAVMQARMIEVQDAGRPWLVAEQAGVVLGYAYAGTWKGRSAFRYTVETTVYLDPECSGLSLYSELLTQLRAAETHIAIGGISLPNEASIGLHEKLGFQHVGTFAQLGFKQERWVDVGYWQLAL